MTADSTILIEIKSDGSGAKVIKRDLDEIAKGSDKAKKSAAEFGSVFNGVLAGLSAQAFAHIVDSLAMIQGRLQNATRSAGEAQQAFSGLREAALNTGAGMETLVSVFQRLSFARDEIGATISDMVLFTDIVSKLGVVSGASTQGMQAGLTQLGQALSAGVVRADEWNSIMENIPAVGKSIADQLGVTTGQLRNLVVNGLLPSEDAFRAVLLAQQDVEKQFMNMPMTIGRSLSILRGEFELFVGQANNASGVSSSFIAIVDAMRVALSGMSYYLERVILGLAALSGSIMAVFDRNVSISDVAKEYDAAVAKLNESFKTPQNTVFDNAFGGSQGTAAIKDQSAELEKLRSKYEALVNASGGGSKGGATSKPTLKANIDQATESSKTLAKTLDKDVGSAIDDLSSKIDRDFAEAFKSAFKGSDGGFKSLLEGWKASFKDFLAEIAYQALARPIIMSIVGSVSGSGAASASSLTGGSSGGGLGSIGNLLSSGGNISSMFGTSQSLVGSVNKLGSLLGIGGVGPNGPVSLSSMSSFTNGSFGGTLGASAGGFAGNLLGNAVFGSDRGIGASIGSTIGSIAGSFIPIPVIGPMIGSFLGNAIGGLFGNKTPPNKLQGGALDLTAMTTSSYGQTGSKFSEQNRKFVDTALSSAQTFATALKNYGATLSGSVDISAGDRTGLTLAVNGAAGVGYGKDTEAFQTALLNAVIGNITDSPDDLKKVLKNVKTLDPETLAEALGVLDLVRAFEKAGEKTKPLEDAITALDAQFKSLKDSATDLGLPTDKLTESYEKQKTALIQNVLSPLQDFLDSQALGGSSSLNPAQRLSLARSQFDTNLSAIQSGDFTNLGDITGQASQLLSVGRDIFASSEAFSALESYVRQSVSGIAGDLGAPNGLNDSVAREISLANAQQISIQQQMLIELQETRAENTRLRKTLERLTNQVVIQA
jgi:tape measure domain-containing protein